ncbi:MAG: hypothetical protein EBV42_06960, partial [Actinobacteria bacterium]|nr:hypothetical protein [Actinomycetota bacterium]
MTNSGATHAKQFPDWVFNGATQFQARLRTTLQPLARFAWKFELDGFGRLPKHGAAILAPNHISFLDSAFLMLLAPRNISFIGKSESRRRCRPRGRGHPTRWQVGVGTQQPRATEES